MALMPQQVRAQVPVDPYNYSRSSSFEYDVTTGLLTSETVEPDNLAFCVKTIYTYDGYGNKKSGTTANCAGAVPVRQQILSRTTSTDYLVPKTAIVNGVSVPLPLGAFAVKATNPLNQSEDREHDPRFGTVTKVTGPNNLSTQWTLDDLGRPVLETRADGTGTVTFYCYLAASGLDTSSNTAGCPVPGASEVPDGAIMFVHSEPRLGSSKTGPFVRAYTDRQGRKIRSVTESFDGSLQPALGLIVQDTDYGPYGQVSVVTQPYFLNTASSTTKGSGDYGVTRTDYDVLGRPLVVYTSDAKGSESVTFGSRGTRPASVNKVSYIGLSRTGTDDKGRTRVEERNVNGQVVRVTDALGAQLAHQHDAFGNLVATRDALQNSITLQYDIRGRKVSMTDPDTGRWQYDYNALGELVWQQNANQRAVGTATTMVYDRLGRLTQRAVPEYVSSWTYDTYPDGSACFKGKLCATTTSHGVKRKLVYDSLGRAVSSRTDVTNGPSFTSTLVYDSLGRVASQTYPTGVKVDYTYTPKGFADKLTLATPATVNGLPATPGGTPPASVSMPANSLLWQAQVVNAWGGLEQQTYGNNVVSRKNIDPNGRITRVTAGQGNASDVLDHSYSWNSLGQLIGRGDANGDGLSGAVSDTFFYDELGRLKSYTVAAPAIPNLARMVNLQYNALGQVLYKSDVGIYAYGPSGPNSVTPHAVSRVTGNIGVSGTADYRYDANGNLISSTDGKYRGISYTSFNLPGSQGVKGGAGGGSAVAYAWQYDENHQRIGETRVVTGGSQAGTRTTWMLHPDNVGGLGFEREINAPVQPSAANPAVSSNRHYLSVGGNSIGVFVSTGALPVLSSSQTAPPALASITLVKLEYWHKDHLGSLAATTGLTPAVTARYAYDPFGKRRYTKGTYDATGELVVDWSAASNRGTDRGYTGHEHLDDVGLIHMNGRLFDPTLGLFLQGDPLIQSEDNLQNYNRYAYCYNNPLTCTDPSGYSFVHWVNPRYVRAVSAVASVAVGVLSSYCGVWAGVCNGVGQAAVSRLLGASEKDSLRTGLVAGLTTYAFQTVGDHYPGYGQAGANGAAATSESIAMNTVLHAVVGCASSKASGGSCTSGALAGGFSAAYGNYVHVSAEGVLAVMESAAVGGLGSMIGGGKFSDGAVTGSFGYLFNFLAHRKWVINPNNIGADSAYGIYFEKAIPKDELGWFGKVLGWLGNDALKTPLNVVSNGQDWTETAICTVEAECYGSRTMSPELRSQALALEPQLQALAERVAANGRFDLNAMSRDNLQTVINAWSSVSGFTRIYGTTENIMKFFKPLSPPRGSRSPHDDGTN